MLDTIYVKQRLFLYRNKIHSIKYNEPLSISTKDGDAVLLSAEDYSGLMETLYLVSVPGMREKVMDGLKQPLDECLDEENVEW